MENYSTYSKETLAVLSERFENINFKFLDKDIGVKINTFIVHGLSSDLENDNNWRIISEEIALKFQSKITSIDEKWNLYIIYVCSDKVNKELKARIENDKFSTRKIVENRQIEKLTDEIANNLIIKHITHTDLVEIVNNTQEKIIKSYSPKNKNIWGLIPKDKSVFRDPKSQKYIIEQLKKINYEN
jgi:hypothetical protein